jgi:hypothetical protein
MKKDKCNFCKLQALKQEAKRQKKEFVMKPAIDVIYKGVEVFIGGQLQCWFPKEPTVCECGGH